LDGWRRFGKGQHRAALNFGDCFCDGLARALEAPLLFQWQAIAATDVLLALTG
jgi:ribonuclease VapC